MDHKTSSSPFRTAGGPPPPPPSTGSGNPNPSSGSGTVPAPQPVSPPQVNLEQQLQDMFMDPAQQPIILCLGQKGGGKSFRTMTLLMWLLRNNVFDQYFLVLPTFHYEAANSYAWLQPFLDKVFVTQEYTPEISQAFLQRADSSVPPHALPRTFLWLDDVGMNEAFRSDRHFVGLLSVARHKRLSVCLCYHSLTSGHTLSPFLRQNVTHTLLFRVTNEKLLESIFEELISMTGHFARFRDFKEVYNRHTCSVIDAGTGAVEKNYNGICINNAVGCLDWNVGEWFPEDTEMLKQFLDKMKEELAAFQLPAPDKSNQLKTLEPTQVGNVKGAQPSVGIQAGTSGTPQRTELTGESWGKIKAAVNTPLVFVQKPKGLVTYEKVPMTFGVRDGVMNRKSLKDVARVRPAPLPPRRPR